MSLARGSIIRAGTEDPMTLRKGGFFLVVILRRNVDTQNETVKALVLPYSEVSSLPQPHQYHPAFSGIALESRFFQSLPDVNPQRAEVSPSPVDAPT